MTEEKDNENWDNWAAFKATSPDLVQAIFDIPGYAPALKKWRGQGVINTHPNAIPLADTYAAEYWSTKHAILTLWAAVGALARQVQLLEGRVEELEAEDDNDDAEEDSDSAGVVEE
ncbi:hypothetical protein AUJ14_00985 [Candidatus Micrarchaeota archaeon CG1_02_55_22]|nr:MAG: hypothetical protein AUJ14_00985 [Candidatus Micrarchaeota archaeon CG1_02_55_22]